MKSVLFVGMDVHKKTIAIGIAEKESGEVRSYGTIANEISHIDRVVRRLVSRGTDLRFAYEAGPCGFGLHRHLRSKGYECMVAAPSLIPRRPGDRIKTDKRDARNLAKLLRAGELTPVHVPDQEDEAMRDLVRCREDAVEAAMRAKQRLKAFLLRHGKSQPGKIRWGKPYINWLATVRMETPVLQITLQEYIDGARECQDRVDHLTAVLEKEASNWKLAAYLGLTPSEHSSGDSVRRGGITKAGNRHVRRALVEAAWTYIRNPRVSRELLKRQKDLPEQIKKISWKAQLRICRRYQDLKRRRKPGQKTVTALARELCCFLWAADRALADI